MPGFALPYFDQILGRLDDRPDSALAEAFRRHVHWGYFEDPATTDDSPAAYARAAEELTRRLCRAAGVESAAAVLDVGCGFGGTLALLNETLGRRHLVGLNIDRRQLARARELVAPRSGNTVDFVEADACALPFAGGRFDVVLAVECIFHFGSRKAFLKEASRILRPSGRLAITDFVLTPGSLDDWVAWTTARVETGGDFYGTNKTPVTSAAYQRAARASRIPLLADEDVTEHTLPTYPAMRRLYGEAELADGVRATDYLEEITRRGWMTYRILSFAKTATTTRS